MTRPIWSSPIALRCLSPRSTRNCAPPVAPSASRCSGPRRKHESNDWTPEAPPALGSQGQGVDANLFALSQDKPFCSIARADRRPFRSFREVGGIRSRNQVAEKLLDRGTPAEAQRVSAANLAGNRQCLQRGGAQVPIEDTGTAVTDYIERPRDR